MKNWWGYAAYILAGGLGLIGIIEGIWIDANRGNETVHRAVTLFIFLRVIDIGVKIDRLIP